MKVWVKTKKYSDIEVPHSINIANAVYGFKELGAEIVPYQSVDEIMQWVTPYDIVIDYIQQVEGVFNKFGIKVESFNYPEVLSEFLGRRVWKDTINHINSHPELWGIFVKPIKEKVFTGRVIKSTIDLVGCGSCYEDYDVLCSDAIDIKREYRGFVVYDKLVDIRPYTGDYHYNLDYTEVDRAMEKFKEWEDRPMGCSVDFGVTADNKTVLIEVNDGYALGSYGLQSLDYAKLISARWAQLFNRVDEFQF